jgi:hypothetical protein
LQKSSVWDLFETCHKCAKNNSGTTRNLEAVVNPVKKMHIFFSRFFDSPAVNIYTGDKILCKRWRSSCNDFTENYSFIVQDTPHRFHCSVTFMYNPVQCKT